MCLLVLHFRQLPGCPLLVGANREEEYDRPSRSPRWLGGCPDVFAGQDLRAGGTWLGVSQTGLLVAVTNRKPEGGTGAPAEGVPGRSRGLLCLDALRQPGARAAVEWCCRHLQVQSYRPYNLLLADGEAAFVIHGRPRPEEVELAPGLHVLADGDVDDGANPRVKRARALASGRVAAPPERAVSGLESVLADRDPAAAPQDWLCRRFPRAGTVSSCVVAVPEEGLRSARFRYAPGPPGERPFEDLSGDLRAGP